MDYEKNLYIIDIQGFQYKDSNFIIKELAIINVNNGLIKHTLIEMQHNMSWFSQDIIKHLDWNTNNTHGLKWKSWNLCPMYELPYEKICSYIEEAVGKSAIILVKGLNKKRVLEKILHPNYCKIIDMDTFNNCPKLCVLRSMYLYSEPYKCNLHENNCLNCSKQNVYLLHQWLVQQITQINNC